MQYSGPLLIVLAAALWALDGLLRRSLYGLPPATLIFFEHIIGFCIIAPFAFRAFLGTHFTKKDYSLALLVSFLSGVVGTLLFTMALGAVGFISFSIVILIQKLQPIFAIGFSLILGKEKIPKFSWLFIPIALISGYFVTFPEGVSFIGDGQKELLAGLYALGAAAAWGISTNFSKMLLVKHAPEVVTFLRFGMTTIILAIGILFLPEWNNSFRLPSGDEWKYLLFIGFSTGLFAMYIYYRGLQKTPVHVSAILELTWPIIAVVMDYYLFGTVFTFGQYVATFTLLCSMYLITYNSIAKK